MENIMDNEFNTKVKEGKGVFIIDFYADWCGPCKMQSPILEELSNEEPKVTIYKLDVDKNQLTAGEYGIQNIPTLLIFKDGELIEKKVGFQPKQVLQNSLKELL